jgi:hypothetical protein
MNGDPADHRLENLQVCCHDCHREQRVHVKRGRTGARTWPPS